MAADRKMNEKHCPARQSSRSLTSPADFLCMGRSMINVPKEDDIMSKSARSVFVFGLYCAILGIILIAVPNLLLQAISRQSTTEVWIRVIGMFLIYLGFYYTQTARKEMTSFFRLTVYTRSTVIFFFVAFVLFGFAGPQLIMFGVIDLLGAIWTGLALRIERTASR